MLAIDWSHTKGLTTYARKGEESTIYVKSKLDFNFPFLAKEIYGLKKNES